MTVRKEVEGTVTTHFLEGTVWIKKVYTLKVNTKKLLLQTKIPTHTFDHNSD